MPYEKKYAFDKLSDMSYTALGHKFYVINSKVHLEKGRKKSANLYMRLLQKMLKVTQCILEPQK